MAKSSGGCAVGFFLIFGLFWTVLVGAFDAITIYGMVRSEQAKSWPAVTGTITHSEIERYTDSDGTTYSADLEYVYEVDGREYAATRYRFGGFTSSSDRSYASGIVRAHPVGAEVDVFYNPDDPADAVLSRGVGGSDYFIALFLTPFNIVMLGLWGIGIAAVYRKVSNAPAGGVPIARRPTSIHVRLPRISTLVAAGVTALVISFISIFVVAFVFGFGDISTTVIGVVWACVLVPAVVVFLWKKLRIGSGARDLIIDRDDRMLSLPQTFGRKEDVIVPVEGITSVEVQQIAHRGSKGGTSYTYAPTLHWTDDAGEPRSDKLAEWMSESRAEAFAEWLREQIEDVGAG